MKHNEFKLDESVKKFFSKPEPDSINFLIDGIGASVQSSLLAGLSASAESASIAAKMQGNEELSSHLRKMAERYALAVDAETQPASAFHVDEVAQILENVGDEIGLPK